MIATKPLELRSNLKKYMDTAFSGNPVMIARPHNENVVIISEKDFNELMKAKHNAEYLAKLDRSYEQIAKGKTISLSIDELRDMEEDNWQPSPKIREFMEHTEDE